MANKETRLYGHVLEHGAIKEYIFDVIDTGRRVKTIDERPFCLLPMLIIFRMI